MLSLGEKLHTLILFRFMTRRSPLMELSALLDTDTKDTLALCDAYTDLAQVVLETGGNLGDALEEGMAEEENLYSRHILYGTGDAETLERMLKREIRILEDAERYDGSDVRLLLGDRTLPAWQTGKNDLGAAYRTWMEKIRSRGFGIFARYRMFILNGAGEPEPILHPDPQRLTDLIGYDRERGLVLANTEAFLNGRPANNMLLYGDAGTGKSSTVKAVCNELADRGLRLIELKKTQLYLLPKLMDVLALNPLRFLLFIDDLTFSSDDRDFCALKAILEGGVNTRGSNILICATSNHRHMVKETVADRTGEEINVSDRMQEIVSLSARFGLTVTFVRADAGLYRTIVLELAARAGLAAEEEDLIREAEAFAIRAGGRNPRTAKHFIELKLSGL